MNGHLLQLSMDLDRWTGKKNARYFAGQTLKTVWDDSQSGQNFYPVGRDEIIKNLKEKSEFRYSIHVQNLKKADFDPGRIITVEDLLTFLEHNARNSPLIGAIVLGIHNWISDRRIIFFGATQLNELWKIHHSAASYNTDGVQKLIKTFSDNEEYFVHCDLVQNHMDAGIFTGGNIATVDSFYNYLKPCEQERRL